MIQQSLSQTGEIVRLNITNDGYRPCVHLHLGLKVVSVWKKLKSVNHEKQCMRMNESPPRVPPQPKMTKQMQPLETILREFTSTLCHRPGMAIRVSNFTSQSAIADVVCGKFEKLATIS